MMKKLLLILVTMILPLLIASCGQDGPLYLPPPTITPKTTTAPKTINKPVKTQSNEQTS